MRSINYIFLINFAFCFACSSAKKEQPTEKDKTSIKAQSKAAEKPAKAAAPFKKVDRPVLFIGVDSLSWDLIDPLMEVGRLPNFKKLVENGARAPLKTLMPTNSPLIWTSIATGVSPSKHGITDFTFKAPGTDETLLPTSNMRRVQALWNMASDRGYNVGVVGWWATYPAERVNGFIVSDQANTLRQQSVKIALNIENELPYSAEAATYPASLGSKIDGLIKNSKEVGVDHMTRFMKLPKQKLEALKQEQVVEVEDIHSIFKVGLLIDQAFLVVSSYAIEKFKPELAMIYLYGLDAAQHHYWKYLYPEKFENLEISKGDIESFGRVITEYYIYMDEAIGRLISLYDADNLTVVIASDHGHHENPSYNPEAADHYNRACSGDHSDAPDGVLIVSGKDVLPGSKPESAHVYDVAPTVLALLGMPASSNMEGKVLTEVLDPAFLKSHPYIGEEAGDTARAYTTTPQRSQMSETLKAKLKGIGYIDDNDQPAQAEEKKHPKTPSESPSEMNDALKNKLKGLGYLDD